MPALLYHGETSSDDPARPILPDVVRFAPRQSPTRLGLRATTANWVPIPDGSQERMKRKTSTQSLYVVLMLMAGAAYGVVTPLVKLGITHGVPVTWLTLAQYPVSLLLFQIGRTGAGPRARPHLQDYLGMAAVGAFGAGVSLTYYHSLTFLPGSVGIVLLFQFTWILPLLSGLFHRHWPNRAQRYGILIVLAGTVMAGGIRGWIFPLPGILLGLASAVLYALSLLLSGRLSPDISPWYRAEISTAFSLALVAVAYQPWRSLHWAYDPATWIWGSLMGLFSQGIPLLLTYISAPKLPPALTGMLASSELPVAVILSALWLGEPVSAARWVGVLVILGGILFSSTVRMRARGPSTK